MDPITRQIWQIYANVVAILGSSCLAISRQEANLQLLRSLGISAPRLENDIIESIGILRRAQERAQNQKRRLAREEIDHVQ